MSLNPSPIHSEGHGLELFTSFCPTTSGMRSIKRRWCDDGKTNSVQYGGICDASGTSKATENET